MPRVLINMSVVLFTLIMSIASCARFKPRCPAQGNFSISSGITDTISMFFLRLAFITSPPAPLPGGERGGRSAAERGERSWLRGDKRTSLACSKFPMVALIPQMESLFVVCCL